MIKEHPSHLLLQEATDSNTSPERLAELSHHNELKKLIAANPATPAERLASLSEVEDEELCRTVAQNPNTPIHILWRLAPRFPRDFLDNPVLPLLILSNPNLISALPEQTWLQLLRCDNVPLSVLQWLQRSPFSTEPQNALTYPCLHSHLTSHVAIAGEVLGHDEQTASQALQEYYQGAKPLDHHISIMFWASSPGSPTRWLRELARMDDRQKACFVRYHPEITAELLDDLAKGEDPAIQQAVALHPLTPVSALSRLASAAPAVRSALATNPKLPTFLLHQLAGDRHYLVRKAVAAHPSTNQADLTILTHDRARSVRAAVAGHPQLSAEMAQLLLHDTKYQVRAALASNAAAPQDVLLALAGDPELAVRQAVARNPQLPASGFSLLMKEGSESMYLCLARNTRLPHALLLQFVDHPLRELRTAIAANPQMSLPLLEELIPQGKLRWLGVARNPHTTPMMLALMAEVGGITAVHNAIAAHERTSAEVLARLSKKNDHALRVKVASHLQTPLNVLKDLLTTNEQQICMKVAEHPTASKNRHIFLEYLLKLMEEYRQHSRPQVLPSMLLKHEKLSLSHLQQFATSPYWPERYLVTRHPAASPALLNDLSRDGSRYVRAAAREAMAKQAGDVLY